MNNLRVLMKRRDFLRTCAILGAGSVAGKIIAEEKTSKSCRIFNLSISPEALDNDPELLKVVYDSGVTDLWLSGFHYGYWYFSIEQIDSWRKRIQKMGMNAHIINIPLGHPGNALGVEEGKLPWKTPNHWKPGVNPDGSTFSGTSLHSPATEENIQAIQKLRKIGVKKIFLDDDFRLAKGPGIIGGCFCEEHQQQFLNIYGYCEVCWMEMLYSIEERKLTSFLRNWINFTCDQLTASFKAQQAAAPDMKLGIMVMYLGAEKAGIRLTDYKGHPMRVGELMFNDESFNPVKSKTNELFSSLFHRRFVSPDLAYSETTAYPADRLSARNMAAKLSVSLLSDVRNTMFMSGGKAFPRTHWQTLAPAMKKSSMFHTKIAGHKPRGPFKHYWGENSRLVGDDNPYSIFLASGVPFEVTENPAGDGWTFLSDFDAQVVASGNLKSKGTTFIFRPESPVKLKDGRAVSESLEGIFAFKREIMPKLKAVPFVLEETPVVCAWYPTIRSILLWNLSENAQKLTVKFKETQRSVTVDGLDVELLENIK